MNLVGLKKGPLVNNANTQIYSVHEHMTREETGEETG